MRLAPYPVSSRAEILSACGATARRPLGLRQRLPAGCSQREQFIAAVASVFIHPVHATRLSTTFLGLGMRNLLRQLLSATADLVVYEEQVAAVVVPRQRSGPAAVQLFGSVEAGERVADLPAVDLILHDAVLALVHYRYLLAPQAEQVSLPDHQFLAFHDLLSLSLSC